MELDESERIRQQQHQQLLLIVSGATEPVKETDGEEKGRMKVGLRSACDAAGAGAHASGPEADGER